jgi:hypothetical protein
MAQQHTIPGNIGRSAVSHVGDLHAPVTRRNGSPGGDSRDTLRRPYGDEAGFEAYDDLLMLVLSELKLTSIPLITRMDFGHTDPKLTLPIGVVAEIDCDTKQIRLLESPTV